MPETRLYDVHAFAVIRRQVSQVAASSPAEAILAAGEQRSLHRWLDQFSDAETVGEFADEISHYLVDVAGDPEFTASRWFHSRHHPWIPLFERLIAWDEEGRAADELTALLANVRQILAETV